MIDKLFARPAQRRLWGAILMTAPFLLYFASDLMPLRDGVGTLAVLVVVLFAVTPGMALYWSGLDELAREAQRKAWFWGGTFGLLAMMVLAVAIQQIPSLAGVLSGYPAADALALGCMMAALGALTGFGLYWAVFWLSKR